MKDLTKKQLEKILRKEVEELETLRADVKVKEHTVLKLMAMIENKEKL